MIEGSQDRGRTATAIQGLADVCGVTELAGARAQGPRNRGTGITNRDPGTTSGRRQQVAGLGKGSNSWRRTRWRMSPGSPGRRSRTSPTRTSESLRPLWRLATEARPGRKSTARFGSGDAGSSLPVLGARQPRGPRRVLPLLPFRSHHGTSVRRLGVPRLDPSGPVPWARYFGSVEDGLGGSLTLDVVRIVRRQPLDGVLQIQHQPSDFGPCLALRVAEK